MISLVEGRSSSSQSPHIASSAIPSTRSQSVISQKISFIPKTTVLGLTTKASKHFNIYKIDPKLNKIESETSFSIATSSYSFCTSIPETNYFIANTLDQAAFLYDYTQLSFLTKFVIETDPKIDLDVILGQSRMVVTDENNAFIIFDTTATRSPELI